jgi:hypothetical protein
MNGILNEQERERFQLLRDRAASGDALSEAEDREVSALMQKIVDAEAAYLGPATERLQGQNRAAEERIRAAEDLIAREERFVQRLTGLVAELEAERDVIQSEWRRLYGNRKRTASAPSTH